jgi:biopolymer transport protein TolQ
VSQMPRFSSETLQAVARVSRCSLSVVHEEMKQGLYGLATIACLAPWVGLFGTIVGIVHSFTRAANYSMSSIASATRAGA